MDPMDAPMDAIMASRPNFVKRLQLRPHMVELLIQTWQKCKELLSFGKCTYENVWGPPIFNIENRLS